MSEKYLIILIFLVFGSLINQTYGASDKVICYYASWAISRPGNGQFTPEDIQANLCTHVNYAFIGLNSDGTLQILDEATDVQAEGFKRVSALKDINPNLKVLFSVGGASADPSVFGMVASDAQKLATLSESALELIRTYNFDGLDVDWEYPRGGDQEKYIALLTALKEAFEPFGYLVTVAVNSIPDEVGGYDIPAMSNVLDVINVMTYDFHSMYDSQTTHNSPLYGGVDESDWQRENRNANASITYWLTGGADPQKLAIGLAFYGHTFVLSDAANHGMGASVAGPGDPGDYTANQGSLGYNEVCEFHPNGETVFLDDMKVPYLHDDTFWIGFDNEESLAVKVNYAKEKNLAGVFIWSIETDDKHGLCGEPFGLLNAIHKNLLT